MHRFDKISEAFRLLGEALDEDPMLSRWEERAVRAASQIERENRAQRLLPFGADYAAAMLDCSPRNVYYLAEKARRRSFEMNLPNLAEGSA